MLRDCQLIMRFVKKLFNLELLIIVAALVPIVVFPSKQLSGDGIVYEKFISTSNYDWNPNHLFVQPLGLLLYNFARLINSALEPVTIQKSVAFFGTIMSIFIFWSSIRKYILPGCWYSSIITFGLVYSNYFLALSNSSEFLIIQMPFLMLVLVMCFTILIKLTDNEMSNKEIIIHGMLLGFCNAIASLFFSSNMLLTCGLLIGLLCLRVKAKYSIKIKLFAVSLGSYNILTLSNLFSIWLFFVSSGKKVTFWKWIISYRGSGEIQLGEYGGLPVNLFELIVRLLRMVFAFLQNIVYTELGVVAKSRFLGVQLECMEFYSTGEIIWWFLMFIIAGAIFFFGLIAPLRYFLKKRDLISINIFILVSFWIASYLVFNFYWNNSDDQFWFQILPAFWTFLALSIKSIEKKKSKRIYLILITVLILLISINNFIYTVMSQNKFDTIKLSRILDNYLPNNSLVIWPGHDRWEAVLYYLKKYKQNKGDYIEYLSLVSISKNSWDIKSLINSSLCRGQRVYLLRILDPDEECVPWGELVDSKWNRHSLVMKFKKDFIIGERKMIIGYSNIYEVLGVK